jgi:hypothetical protein
MQKKPEKKTLSAIVLLVFGFLIAGTEGEGPTFADSFDGLKNPVGGSPADIRVDRKFSLTYLLESDGSKLVAESRRHPTGLPVPPHRGEGRCLSGEGSA